MSNFRSIRAWFPSPLPATLGLLIVLCVFCAAQCAGIPNPPGLTGIYNNTTDATNGGATYIGSAACTACHADYASLHAVHGHRNALTRIQNQAPAYPDEGSRAGVPDPPPGVSWGEISYVIGGYTKAALFVDLGGFILTSGQLGADTKWNLAFPPHGTSPAFEAYRADATTPLPFDYSCFRCHATGSMPPDSANPQFQDNRPGIAGTWMEEGVQCESCHGPGSRHVNRTGARDLYVSNTPESCGQCHAGIDPDIIEAEGGFIAHNQQWAELRASGGHKDFSCLFCHDSHSSTIYARERGIRNNCTVCHTNNNMALHEGKVFTRGDYTEVLSCESCHMPFAARIGSAAPASFVGPTARVGDIRSHVFRISTAPVNYTGILSADGRSVLKDAEGRAALSVDYVCLRCHNGDGLFNLTVARAAEIAINVHLELP